MFHLAAPEVKGLGVMVSTPDLVRSVQSLSFFGLPERVAITATESVTKPLYLFWFHVGATIPASTSFCMSGSRERSTMSAFCPAMTARVWSPEAPYDWVNVM